ncbi:MAG: outer membrane beta-barrel protein [Bacteroidetes bacterium]|nr:outer membrane beta-barrel protein [Bacteroidota bacterium]MBS1739382.1 outer membrane beta-barrel protein [Bacteroidota bacterium]
MYKLLFSLLVLLFFHAYDRVVAQERSIEPFVRTGIVIPIVCFTNAQFFPTPSISGGCNYYIPVSKSFSVKFGLSYEWQQMHFNGQSLFDSASYTTLANGLINLHYIALPLQLSYVIELADGKALRTSLGMSYGFLMYAQTKGKSQDFINGQQQAETNFHYANYVGMTPSKNYRDDRTELSGFAPAVYMDIKYQFRPKWLVGFFYRYNINDVSVNPGKSTVRMHTAGAVFSVYLSAWKKQKQAE